MAPIVEMHDHLIMAEGKDRWDLVIQPEKIVYPKCDYDALMAEEDDHIGKGTITKTFNELLATRRSDQRQTILIGAQDFHVESGDECLAHEGELERDWQLVAIAGPIVLYTDKVFDEGTCSMVMEWTMLNLKIASLTGNATLAGFEAELPNAALTRLRKQAAKEITLES